ncbi:MAG TPA: hypothetical protein VG053_06575 [Solirubrobacteraceae bacterium]|nr:hypothetical protein [Solirubrobacteraceae bacterium]
MTVVTPRTGLDRLIHGRAWIGLVAFALIGIVTMQLGLLKLNAGIGRALEHEAALQRENSALSVENSEVAAGDTVELQAAHMGMRLIPAGSLRFLSAQGSQSEIGRAVAALNARAGGAATASTSSESSSAPGSEASSTSSSAGESESTSSTTTSGREEASPSASSPETGRTGTAASGEAPASSERPPSGAESGASEATPTPAPSGESGGASAGPGG